LTKPVKICGYATASASSALQSHVEFLGLIDIANSHTKVNTYQYSRNDINNFLMLTSLKANIVIEKILIEYCYTIINIKCILFHRHIPVQYQYTIPGDSASSFKKN
jgi:hypothetical protein